MSSEDALVQRIAELQVRIQYLDSMYRSRQEDLQQLSQHFDQSFNADNTSNLPHLQDMKQFLKNISGLHVSSGLNPGNFFMLLTEQKRIFNIILFLTICII